MIKLVGSVCVLFAGGSVWWLQRQEQRRRRQIVAELASTLERMETAIRLNRTPLLPLFRQAARGRCHEVSQLFERSVAALAAGRSPEIVWCQTVSCLPVSETDKRALSELSMPCKAMKRAPVKVYCLQEKSCKTACHNWKSSAPMRKNARRPFVFPPQRCW